MLARTIEMTRSWSTRHPGDIPFFVEQILKQVERARASG